MFLFLFILFHFLIYIFLLIIFLFNCGKPPRLPLEGLPKVTTKVASDTGGFVGPSEPYGSGGGMHLWSVDIYIHNHLDPPTDRPFLELAQMQ